MVLPLATKDCIPLSLVIPYPQARANLEQVTAAIVKGLERGHIAEPFAHPPPPPPPPLNNFRSCPLGAVPKKDGTSRLIIDLSLPNSGLSINDFIRKEDYSVTFPSLMM